MRIALVDRRGQYSYCINAAHGTCNWLISADSSEQYCVACRHNRTIPDIGQPETLAHWRRIEIAKHRLFYSLLRLHLSTKTKAEGPDGLAFDFLADDPTASSSTLMTSHASGVITINIAEADDAERERRRRQMGEPYRTLLGHFRHEIGDYYWQWLVSGQEKLDEFRPIFGDERAEYSQALQRYYKSGAPADWPDHFISAYAAAHPWEDFAETWAHYFRMVDTLETAAWFGLAVAPKVPKSVAARVDFDPYQADMGRLIEAWIPLTFAANSMNRSMGLSDLYPFVLSPPVIAKLAFVQACIHAKAGRQTPINNSLRAMIAGLRRRTGIGTQP
jgi:hypothetical protein